MRGKDDEHDYLFKGGCPAPAEPAMSWVRSQPSLGGAVSAQHPWVEPDASACAGRWSQRWGPGERRVGVLGRAVGGTGGAGAVGWRLKCCQRSEGSLTAALGAGDCLWP